MGLFDVFKKKKAAEAAEKPSFGYDTDQRRRFKAFFDEQFNEIEYVITRKLSDGMELDIAVMPPTEQHNYYKVLTAGMGAYRMNVPREAAKYELDRAELLIFLPPDWEIMSDEPRYRWPIDALCAIAMHIVSGNNWIMSGINLAGNAECSPYDESTGFSNMQLFEALNKDLRKIDFSIKGLGKINVYQLMPLYKEERDYKNAHGLNALIERFDSIDTIPIVNNNRKNYGIE